MIFAKNIIRKKTVHFNYNGHVDGFALQKEVSDWCTRTLLPQLEQQLEPYCGIAEYLSLDKLEIEAVIDGADWQQKVQQQILASIKLQVEQHRLTISGKQQFESQALSQKDETLVQPSSDAAGHGKERQNLGNGQRELLLKAYHAQQAKGVKGVTKGDEKKAANKITKPGQEKIIGEIGSHIAEPQSDMDKKAGKRPDEPIAAKPVIEKHGTPQKTEADDTALGKNDTDEALGSTAPPQTAKKTVAVQKEEPQRNNPVASTTNELQSKDTAAPETNVFQSNNAIARKMDELVVFFFKYGYLPWWHQAVIASDFETAMKSWVTETKPQARAATIGQQLQQADVEQTLIRMSQYIPAQLFFQFTKNIFYKEAELLEQLETFFAQQLFKNIPAAKQRPVAAVAYGIILSGLLTTASINVPMLLQAVIAELQKQKAVALLLPVSPSKQGDAINPMEDVWQQLLLQHQGQTTPEMGGAGKAPKQKAAAQKKQLRFDKTIDSLKEQPIRKNINMAADLREGVFIENAGVVIIAAFLPAFFTNLKLLKKGSLPKAGTAAMLVQHIVTGHTKVAEFELLLPKILCGISPETAVNTSKRITKLQKQEAEQMLLSVIRHWTILKDTSVQGLRETFLQRSGKLIFNNNEWLLQVEQKPFDMLLQQLPWNISMIKLPWMQHLLRTEWV